jgi:adenylate kinase
MIIAITGTPGTGKTSVAEQIRDKDFEVIDLNLVAKQEGFVLGVDRKRKSNIVDIKKLDKHVLENYSDRDIVFIEGHLSHLLKNVNKVIILRCHPKKLKENLIKKGWSIEKINENVESEILDIIFCEAVDLHPVGNIFEIDVTKKSVKNVSDIISYMIKCEFKNMKKYKIGDIDWSEEILKDF